MADTIFDFATAEGKLRSGMTVKRLAWAGDAVLCLCKNYVMVSHEVPGSHVQLLDRGYGAFWDITSEDRSATDWAVCD